MNIKEMRVTITPLTIINITLTLLGLWLLYQIRDIVTLLLIVISLVVIFSPVIRSWERYIPRPLAILVLYTLVILSFVLLTALIIPILIRQLSDFLTYLQSYLSSSGYSSDVVFQRFHDSVDLFFQGRSLEALSQFSGSLGKLYNTTLGFLGGIFALVTIIITSFYLLLEEKNFHVFLENVVPPTTHKKLIVIIDKISDKMSSYLRGQLTLMGIVGLISGIGMAILGVPYPLLLGLWAGLTELIPVVGPVIGAALGVFLAFNTLGLTKALIAVLIYFVIQQLESQFLVPRIMGKALGLSPVVIIFALLIGGKLLGFVGVVIAVPVAAALSVLYEEWRPASVK